MFDIEAIKSNLTFLARVNTRAEFVARTYYEIRNGFPLNSWQNHYFSKFKVEDNDILAVEFVSYGGGQELSTWVRFPAAYLQDDTWIKPVTLTEPEKALRKLRKLAKTDRRAIRGK